MKRLKILTGAEVMCLLCCKYQYIRPIFSVIFVRYNAFNVDNASRILEESKKDKKFSPDNGTI